MNRNISIHVRLNEKEFDKLNEHVNTLGWSRGKYFRSLLDGAVLKVPPPLEYHKLLKEFNYLGNNINQLVKSSYCNVMDVSEAQKQLNRFHELITLLDNKVRGFA
ncbi:hypothetical protein A4S06_10935 [Erysipelotrichaceae bacterium MTC7]|nr:hypothetical protein A4S06_10935 [Erysipelotrichaceae bacterium MTC7]